MSAPPRPTGLSGNVPAIDKRVADVINMLFEPKMMESELKMFGMDIERKPLAAYTITDVTNGLEILEDMEFRTNKIMQDRKIAEQAIGRRKKRLHAYVDDDLYKLKKKASDLFKLISFETSFENESESKKDHNKFEILKWNFEKKIWMLSALEAFVDNYYMARQPRHSLLANFAVKMTAVEKDSPDYQLIAEYMNIGMNPEMRADLVDIVKLKAPKQSYRGPKVSSKLLWVGIPRCELVRVLEKGKVPIPERVTRQANCFGQMIVFNDVFGAALSNSKALRGSETLLFLCAVHLGKAWTVTSEDPVVEEVVEKKKCDFVLGQGKEFPDENGDVIHSEGYTIPIGQKKHRFEWNEHVDSHTFTHNQYGIFKTSGVDLKFAVWCRLHESTNLYESP